MNRRTIAATALGFDYAEMGHYLYQPSRFTVPVWAVGDHYYTVAREPELSRIERDRNGVANSWVWELHPDRYAQTLAGAMNPPRKVWRTPG